MKRKLAAGLLLALIVTGIPAAAILRADNAAKPMTSHDFTDVPVVGQEFMEPYINAFFHQGITGGCSTSPLMYCPTNPVTRGSMAVFMGRALGYVDMLGDGLSARAYFKQTGTLSTQHGVVGRSVDGSGVMGVSDSGFGVEGVSGSGYGVHGRSSTGYGMEGRSVSSAGVYGQSTNNFGVSARSFTATALSANGGADDFRDTIYDLALVGSFGEIFGSALYFYSNSDFTFVLDKDNNGSNELFVVRDNLFTSFLWVSETSGVTVNAPTNNTTDSIYDLTLDGAWGELFGSAIHMFSNNGFIITLDKDNNTTDYFIIRDAAGTDQFIVSETGDTTVNGNLQINGSTFATGSKSAIVDTVSHGTRAMYAVEATEVLFEDMGTAQLVDGVIVIEFDPIFAETVNLDEPYQVFLTPVGGWAELYVEQKTATSFTVRATDPDSNLQFDYRIVAKRLGYEDVRMEEVNP